VDRNFSSSATFLYKFIFPPIWIALCGSLLFQLSLIARPHPLSNNYVELGAGFLWVAGSVLILRFSLPLLRLQLRDGHLYDSNHCSEI